MPRLRTISQCVEEILKLDPDSAIKEWFIRSLCKTKKIDYVPNGTKSLVNLDSLLEYLNTAHVWLNWL